jgi:hypothetical protein
MSESQKVVSERSNRAHLSYRSRLTLYLYLPIAVGVIGLGVIFGSLGAILVYLGAKGDSHIKLFGQSIESADAGVVSIFIGAVVVVVVIHGLLKTTRELASLEGTRDLLEVDNNSLISSRRLNGDNKAFMLRVAKAVEEGKKDNAARLKKGATARMLRDREIRGLSNADEEDRDADAKD